MKWLPLLWAALRRKLGRTVLTLLSIVIAFLLVGTATGLNASFARLVSEARADRVVVTARFGAWIPNTYANQIRQFDGVNAISSLATIESTYQDQNNSLLINMTDPAMAVVTPEYNITPEIFAEVERVPDGLIISNSIAERFSWSVGDRIPLEFEQLNKEGTRDWNYQIVKIVPDISLIPEGFTIGNFLYFDEERGRRFNDVHQIQFLIDDAEQAGAMANVVEEYFANSQTPVTVMPDRTRTETQLQAVFNMQFFTYAITAAALFMLAFLTCNVMAQAVRERIPEFAVMKTIGFTDWGIFGLIVAEASILCLAGAGFGLLLAGVIPNIVNVGQLGVIMPSVPSPIITPVVAGFALAAALSIAIVSGVPSAWRIKRLSIAAALGGR